MTDDIPDPFDSLLSSNFESSSSSSPSSPQQQQQQQPTQAQIPRRSSFLVEDEGVLRDVLEELDRERHKRAELEAQVRVLQEELHSQHRKNSSSTKASVRDYTMVITERDGYKEILDALTEDRPAFSASAQQKNKKNGFSASNNNNTPPTTLPIHIIRLLEVMPWDSRAQQYVFGMEQVYEWQIYGADRNWQKELRFFPNFFKGLPVVMPTPGKTVSEVSRSPFGNIAPPKQCVLTNLEATTILNIDKGYPLPEDGGSWTWVGAWRVEKNLGTDDQGWMYSNDVEIVTDPDTYQNEFILPEKGRPNIVKRRRKWTRLRVLVDYPHASKMTREYLKLVAEKATLEVNVDKLSGQLVETKMCLTDLEADHLAHQEKSEKRLRELELDLKQKNQILGIVEDGAGLKLTTENDNTQITATGTEPTDHQKKVDQVAEIRSAVTQWVANAVVHHKQRQPSNGQDVAAATENGNDVSTDAISTSDGDFLNKNKDKAQSDSYTPKGSPNQTSTTPSHDPKKEFIDSLRDKGTGLFEILKQKGGKELDKIKQGGTNLPWHRKGDSGTVTTADINAVVSTLDETTNESIHATVAKLQTLESSQSTATSGTSSDTT